MFDFKITIWIKFSVLTPLLLLDLYDLTLSFTFFKRLHTTINVPVSALLGRYTRPYEVMEIQEFKTCTWMHHQVSLRVSNTDREQRREAGINPRRWMKTWLRCSAEFFIKWLLVQSVSVAASLTRFTHQAFGAWCPLISIVDIESSFQINFWFKTLIISPLLEGPLGIFVLNSKHHLHTAYVCFNGI